MASSMFFPIIQAIALFLASCTHASRSLSNAALRFTQSRGGDGQLQEPSLGYQHHLDAKLALHTCKSAAVAIPSPNRHLGPDPPKDLPDHRCRMSFRSRAYTNQKVRDHIRTQDTRYSWLHHSRRSEGTGRPSRLDATHNQVVRTPYFRSSTLQQSPTTKPT